MAVECYELDREVFSLLNSERDTLDDWQANASKIADYVAAWGLERFWAMSRCPDLAQGKSPEQTFDQTDNDVSDQSNKKEQKKYFAWQVAREVLCKTLGKNLPIKADMSTEDFQKCLENLGSSQYQKQILIAEVLIEIADTIQFWTMRLKDAQKANQPP